MSEMTELQKMATIQSLQSELQETESVYFYYHPHEGPMPKTFDEFRALPQPHRDQIMRDNPLLMSDLQNTQTILNEIADRNTKEKARLDFLAQTGCPVKSLSEFNELPPKQRQEIARKITPDQMSVLSGEQPKSNLL